MHSSFQIKNFVCKAGLVYLNVMVLDRQMHANDAMLVIKVFFNKIILNFFLVLYSYKRIF